mgnify:CR=1 FL=1
MLSFQKILCPTDFSEPSLDGIAYGADLAKRYQAVLSLVHVVPVLPAIRTDPNYVALVPEYERALHDDAQRQLDALGKDLAAKGLEVRTIVGHGDPGNEIVRIAKDEAADIIVIATQGNTGWRHLVFGSVAAKVVRLAQLPVLTVPGAKKEST